MAAGFTDARPLLREFRPAWAVHAALRFASCDYEVLPVPLPDAPSDLGVDPIGGPVLVDDSSIAQGTERCLHLVESRAADVGVMMLREDQSDADRAALEALLSLVLSKLEAIATYVEFIADPERSEAPERALVPLAVRWLVRRQRSARAAAILDAAGITTEDDAKAVATAAYRALGAVLANALEDADEDDEDEAGPFFFGSRPTILDAAVFGHLQRVQNSVASKWLDTCGYGSQLEGLRLTILERYFGGAGRKRRSDAVLLLGPHWCGVAADLVGDKPTKGGWTPFTLGIAAVIVGGGLLAAVISARTATPPTTTSTTQ